MPTHMSRGRPPPGGSSVSSGRPLYAHPATSTASPGARERLAHAGEESPLLMDVLDRVLDKGIVMDAWVRMSGVGIDLATADARVVVESLDAYVTRADVV